LSGWINEDLLVSLPSDHGLRAVVLDYKLPCH
jgi:hypothetical protein